MLLLRFPQIPHPREGSGFIQNPLELLRESTAAAPELIRTHFWEINSKMVIPGSAPTLCGAHSAFFSSLIKHKIPDVSPAQVFSSKSVLRPTRQAAINDFPRGIRKNQFHEFSGPPRGHQVYPGNCKLNYGCSCINPGLGRAVPNKNVSLWLNMSRTCWEPQAGRVKSGFLLWAGGFFFLLFYFFFGSWL